MHELVRTNNAVLITAIEALLKGAGIPHAVLDQHMSVMEGSLGMLPRRIVVGDDDRDGARQLLEEAGLGHELRGETRPADVRRADADTTDDAVLGGRLRLIQKRSGHRFGHDAILLAASAPARPGDRAVELGAGVGAAGLALALRVPDVTVDLVEIDSELAALARDNAVRNGLSGRVRVAALDATAEAPAFAEHGIEPGAADCVLMNPPFNDSGRQSVSPDELRRRAHVATDGLLAAWMASASRLLHSAGQAALIWRADGLAEVLAALPADFGGVTVLPVYGRSGYPAIRVLVRARKGDRSPLSILPGLDLNDSAGRPTEAAERVLRHAQALE